MNSTSPRITSIVLAAIALFAAGALAPGAATAKKKARPFTLTLLHNNDGESKLATGDSLPKYGGAGRFATVVERLRDEAERGNGKAPRGSLLVSSGDNFLAGLALLAGFDGGPPWPDSIVANALNYDAMTLGNHEFDFGQVRLAEYIGGVKPSIPFVSANLGFDDTAPELAELAGDGRIAPSVVVKRAGEKIGVIGLTTPDIATISSPGNVEIGTDLAAAVNGEVKRLRARKVNKVVVSAHLQGLAADEALIPETRGVDVWIAGGGDDLLASPGDTLIPGDVAVGEYPATVADAKDADVLVISTSGEYRYVGRLTVKFSPQGEVRKVSNGKSGPVRVSGNPADEDFADETARLRAVVDEVAEFVADLAAQQVGETEVDLLRTAQGSPANDPIRRRESGFGNLVADSFLWKAQQLAGGLPDVDEPQVAMANGGGIRADLLTGDIDRSQTFSTLPFFNQVVVVEDIGCEPLRQLLERAVSGLPGIEGRFAAIAGLRAEVDPAMSAQTVTGAPPVSIVTPGERVRDLWLDNGTPQDTADDTQLIDDGVAVGGCLAVDLATTDFTARDGDAYPFSGLGLPFVSVGALYNQALEDYIAAPVLDGGLGGVVTAAQYPEDPVGVRRLTIAGD